VFPGRAIGARGSAGGEVVFTTAMTGYEEVLSDPSYRGQVVTMAYPLIGNYGVSGEAWESRRPQVRAFVVGESAEVPHHWQSERTLSSALERGEVVGIADVDTRRLVRHLRTHGAQMGIVSSEGHSAAALVERARRAPGMEGRDLVTGITATAPYLFTEHLPSVFGPPRPPAELRFDVVAYDYGLKKAMIQLLVDAGCRVTVVPAATTAEEVLARKPSGVFLTNGPGDPAAVPGAERAVAGLLGKVPVFGICLGHQILARAVGAKTYKMKFGHRGANQPVKDLITGKVEITAQNHGFAVDEASVKGKARVTHLNLNDHTVEGLEIADARAFSVQYHPESSPGPHDARHLFARFTQAMAR